MAIRDVSTASLAELVSLEGKSAVVTGGARGIGFGIAARLAEAGARVVVADRDEGVAKESADELLGRGYEVLGMFVDVAALGSVAYLADRTVREFGAIDIWVNNAGIFPGKAALEMTEADWDEVLDINLKGTFFGSREAAARMEGRGGVIINVASTAAFKGYAGIAHYVASKHGVAGLTKSLAAELAPMGIRVLALAPTLILTPGIEEQRETLMEAGLGDPAETVVPFIPLGRAGVPDDVARVALFCASDLSLFMTGSTLPVDGGNLAL